MNIVSTSLPGGVYKHRVVIEMRIAINRDNDDCADDVAPSLDEEHGDSDPLDDIREDIATVVERLGKAESWIEGFRTAASEIKAATNIK